MEVDSESAAVAALQREQNKKQIENTTFQNTLEKTTYRGRIRALRSDVTPFYLISFGHVKPKRLERFATDLLLD